MHDEEPTAAEMMASIEAVIPTLKEAAEYMDEIVRLQDMLIDRQTQLMAAQAEILDLRRSLLVTLSGNS